jgi:hypothetical protein
MTNHPSSHLLRRAADALGLSSQAVDVTLDRSRFRLLVDLDHAEHQRRRAAGAGTITNRYDLHALWEVPHGLAVSANTLPDDIRRHLTRLAPGIVAWTGPGTCTRHHPDTDPPPGSS